MVLLPQAKELAEKKAQKLQEMDENLKAKMTAAEERRQKLISGLFRARALAAQSAVNACSVPLPAEPSGLNQVTDVTQKPWRRRPFRPLLHEGPSRSCGRSPPPESKQRLGQLV